MAPHAAASGFRRPRPGGPWSLSLLLLAACGAAPEGSFSLRRADGSAPGEVTELDFGAVPMGTQARLTLALANTGAGTLPTGTLTRSGSDAFEAQLASTPLPPGAVRALDVSFSPPLEPSPFVREQPFSAQLRLSTGTQERLIRLLGVGVRADCPQLPSALDFGSLASSAPSASLAITLANPGPGAAEAWVGPITAERVAGRFSSAEAGPLVLAQGQSKTLALSFEPGADGEARAFIEVRPSQRCPLQRVTLLGSSTSRPVEFAPAPLDFGDVPVGMPRSLEAVARNHTTRPVTLTQLRTSRQDYSIPSATLTVAPATVGADAMGNRRVTPGEAPLTVGFRPSANGPLPGTLTAAVPFDVQSTAMLQLRGEGGGRDIEVRPAPLALGPVGVGTQLTRALTIANVGNRAQPPSPERNLKLGDGTRFWSVVAKNTDTSTEELCVGELEQGLCSNAPSPQRYEPALGLAGGTQLEVPVTVMPKSVGAKAWEVTVSSNDLDEPVVTVTVTADAT